MASTIAVHKIVLEYLAGLIDRKAFTVRFAEMLYGIENRVGPCEIELVRSIESRLGEAVCGLISEKDFRSALSLCIAGSSIEVEVFDRDDKTFRFAKEDSSSPYKASKVLLV